MIWLHITESVCNSFVQMLGGTDTLPSGESNRVSYQYCLACGHAWVGYEGDRQSCVSCTSQRISHPVTLSHLRRVLADAQKQADAGRLSVEEFNDRKIRIAERFRKAAPVYAHRAEEVFPKVSSRYLDGDLSDRNLNALIFSFHLFTELGLHDAAVRCGMLIGSGFFFRAQDKEIRDIADLVDSAASRVWFNHLGQEEWVATVDLLIGLKAGHAVVDSIRTKYRFLQISRVHLNRARQYYNTKDLPDIRCRIEKESDWINEQLAQAITAISNLDAAEINARSRLAAADIVRDGLNHVADEIGVLASATQAGLGEVADAIHNGLDSIGEGIDRAGGRITTALTEGARYIGDSTKAAGYAISTGIVHHSKEVREGVSELASEARKSLTAASSQTSDAMRGLGTKAALGMVGGAALHAILVNGTLQNLVQRIVPEVQNEAQGLKHLESTNDIFTQLLTR